MEKRYKLYKVFTLMGFFLFSFHCGAEIINRDSMLSYDIFRRARAIFHEMKVTKISGIGIEETKPGIRQSAPFIRGGTKTQIIILEGDKEIELNLSSKSFVATVLGTIFINGKQIMQGESTGMGDWEQGQVKIKAATSGAIVLVYQPDLEWWQYPHLAEEVRAGNHIEGTDINWQPFSTVDGLYHWSDQIRLEIEIGDVRGEVRINDWFLEKPEEGNDERSAGIHDHYPEWWIEAPEEGYKPTIEFHIGVGNPYKPEEAIGYMVKYEEENGSYREIDRVPMYYGSTHPLFCQFLPDGTLKYPPHAWVTTSKNDEVPSFWSVVEVSAQLWKNVDEGD